MTGTRVRWSAIGAAVAVSLGAGGIGLVSATSPAGAAAFVPIEPCRVADTRSNPAFNTGPRSTPIGSEETHTIAAHGDNGDCVGIPASATGLSLNVTALDATALTFLAIWETGLDRPVVSSLNPSPGQPPTPNAVATGLSAGGEFNIFNRAGSVDVIVDINGYYTDHNHDDRYLTETEVDDKISDATIGGVPGPPGPAGADGTELFDRTVVVNGGAKPEANGEALRAAVAAVNGNAPTSTDPWTVFLEPGVFELTSVLEIPDHVTLTGSGMEATTVTGVGVSTGGSGLVQFGIGTLRDIEVSGSDLFSAVSSNGSMRVESARVVIDDSFAAIDLDNGPHTISDSEVVVTAVSNGIGIYPTGADVEVRGTSLTSLGGSSVELIYMNGGNVVVDHSTIDGQATGIFSCCTVAGGTLTVRHSAIDVTRRAIVANTVGIAASIESSTLIGVSGSDVVSLNAGSSVVMRHSTVVGGTLGGNPAPAETCIGTATATAFLTNTCP